MHQKDLLLSSQWEAEIKNNISQKPLHPTGLKNA